MACLSELRFSRITVIVGDEDLSGYLPVFRVARRLGDLPEITVHKPDGSEERYEHFAQIGREASAGMARSRTGRKVRNLWHYRATLGRDSFLAGLRRAAGYLLLDDELDNFTYDLANRDELLAWIAASFEAPEADVRRLAAELEDDAELAASLAARLAGRGRRRRRLFYGRRLGWYVLARLSRPRLAIETGVHDGLGTAILGRALARNTAGGHPGRLLSFDVNADCGWLVEPRLAGDHRIVIGDARKTLPEAIKDEPVDFFIHDSLHTYEHETFEFERIAERAAPGAVLLSDNAHAGTAMADFCLRHGLKYFYFAERSRDHFYPGAGIGFARWRSKSAGGTSDQRRHAPKVSSSKSRSAYVCCSRILDIPV
jgi:predicted O-methyltransferase YrrM